MKKNAHHIMRRNGDGKSAKVIIKTSETKLKTKQQQQRKKK